MEREIFLGLQPDKRTLCTLWFKDLLHVDTVVKLQIRRYRRYRWGECGVS